MKASVSTLFGAAALVVACNAQAPVPVLPSGSTPLVAAPIADGSTARVHPDMRVIVGVDASNTVILEPLVEVFPPDRGVGAVVHLVFEQADPPVILGIEGAVAFLAAYAPEGRAVVDRIVEFDGDSVDLPGGEYVLRIYYRTCDGNCGVLDPAQDFCDIDVSLVAGGDYDVRVLIADSDVAHCEFQPRPS